MKREEIKAMLGDGATDEVVDKLLNAMHTEIEQHKKAAKTAQDALAAKVAEIDELSKKSTDADELKNQLNDLKAKYDAETREAAEKLAQIEFDGAVKDVLTKHGARSEKAVRAMLDLDALKKSNNRNDDIEKAVTALKESDAYLFDAEPTGLKRDVGVNIVPPPALGGSPAQPDETGGFPPACPASAKDKTGPSPGRFRFQSAALIDGRPAFRGTPEKGLSGGNEPGEAAPPTANRSGAHSSRTCCACTAPLTDAPAPLFLRRIPLRHPPAMGEAPPEGTAGWDLSSLPPRTVHSHGPACKAQRGNQAALRFLSRLCRQSAKRLCDARRAAGVVQRKLHV